MMRFSRNGRFCDASPIRMPTDFLLSLIMVSAVSCQVPNSHVRHDNLLGKALSPTSEANLLEWPSEGWSAMAFVAQRALYLTEEELLELSGKVFNVGENFCGSWNERGRTYREYYTLAIAVDREFAHVVRLLSICGMVEPPECGAHEASLRPCSQSEIDSNEFLGVCLARRGDSAAPIVALLFAVDCSEVEQGQFEVRCLSSSRMEHKDLLLRERGHVRRQTESPQTR